MTHETQTSCNIPSPDPIHAGSYRELQFELINYSEDSVVNLNNPTNISFALTRYGAYDNDILLKFTKKDKLGNLPRITIDKNKSNVMSVFLYSFDTIDFEDSVYCFQISLHSADSSLDSVIGEGRIHIFKKI